MTIQKKYWQEPGWDPLSARRKYPWRLSDRSEWQDVLSTYDCCLDEADTTEPVKPEPEADCDD